MAYESVSGPDGYIVARRLVARKTRASVATVYIYTTARGLVFTRERAPHDAQGGVISFDVFC